MANIHMMFMQDERLNLDTQWPEVGTGAKYTSMYFSCLSLMYSLISMHRDAGLSTNQLFFTGSIMTLHMYICCHKDHFPVYKEWCTELGIYIHPHAIPPTKSSNGQQQTLNGVITVQP
jgi:hypothetical protein